MSFGPPAVNPTTKCTGRLGYLSAPMAGLSASIQRLASPRATAGKRDARMNLLHGYADGVDDLGPFLCLIENALAEIGRRSRHHGSSQVGQSRLDVGIRQRSVDLSIEFVDDLRRRPLRRAHSTPCTRLVAGNGLG